MNSPQIFVFIRGLVCTSVDGGFETAANFSTIYQLMIHFPEGMFPTAELAPHVCDGELSHAQDS